MMKPASYLNSSKCFSKCSSFSPRLSKQCQVARASQRLSVESLCQVPTQTRKADLIQRREFLSLTGFLLAGLTAGESTAATRGFSQYIKKRKLDPIETYIPAILQARAQLLDVPSVAVSDAAAGRELLRTGALDGLRDNIRALGEYAVQGGRSEAEGSQLVNGFFNTIQGLDFTLLQSVRSKTPPDEEAIKGRLEEVVAALDRLLATVPADVVSKAQDIVNALASTAPASPEAESGPATYDSSLDTLFLK